MPLTQVAELEIRTSQIDMEQGCILGSMLISIIYRRSI
jgi:hypothetical protein